MKRIKQKPFRLNRMAAKCLMVCAALAIGHLSANAGTMDFHDWSATFTGSGYAFTNTSSAGTISGSSASPGFANSPGTFGVPTVITSQLFTNEFNIDGTGGVGASATFNFSSGYGWGTGGELLLGNIHNYFEYTLSAFDFSNNPINVNAWTLGTEYPSSAPGTLGYFSTSITQEAASGNSEEFYVSDPLAAANSGQGGVLTLTGLTNVGRIQLTLTSSSLGQNAQSDDFILFNVGTPAGVPEPGTYGLCGAGLLFVGLLRRRKKQSD